MIISHESKYIFIHVPKTSGTSIEKQFGDIDGEVFSQVTLNRPKIRTEQCHALKHTNIRDALAILGPTGDEYYAWSIARNPFDRFIEQYYWQKKYEHGFGDRYPNVNNYLERYVSVARTCWEMVSIDGKPACEVFDYDAIGGSDQIVASVSTHIHRYNPAFPIMDKLTVEINHNMREDRRHYTEVLTLATRRALELKFADDIEIFGYEW